jgi:hypothetical protein
MFLEDLDGSGKPDVLISGSGASMVGVLLNDGAGNFANASQHPTGPFNSNVIAANLNADALPDVIAANRDGNTISVLLNSTGATSAPGPSPLAGFHLGKAWPNPTRFATRIAYSTPRPERITISVYDVAGRVVAELLNGMVPAGESALSWDGRDATGRLVSAGVYSVRMEAQGFSATERVVRLR